MKADYPSINSSEITDEDCYWNRRRFLQAAGLMSGAAVFNASGNVERQVLRHGETAGNGPGWLREKVSAATPGGFSSRETPAPYDLVTQYNNFYEFGTAKSDPYENAQQFRTDPWRVEIAGEAEVTGDFTLEDILSPHDLEERIYRLRCVEAWSMVVPWIGFPLKDLISRFRPTSQAKYVRFETLFDPSQMPGQRSSFSAIGYPYVEALRMDEASNDLTLLAVGVYGRTLPAQNGAPLRLVVPWKYGFKSIKSIVKIEFTRQRPRTTWEVAAPREYGFFANVNPSVDHPRWSQASERRLPDGLFSRDRMETLPYNGYAPQVAHLYKDMNLRRYF